MNTWISHLVRSLVNMQKGSESEMEIVLAFIIYLAGVVLAVFLMSIIAKVIPSQWGCGTVFAWIIAGAVVAIILTPLLGGHVAPWFGVATCVSPYIFIAAYSIYQENKH